MTQSLFSPKRLLALLAMLVLTGVFTASFSHATLLDEKKALEHYDDVYRIFLKKKIAKRFVLKEVLTDDSVTREAIYFLNAIQAARLDNYLHLVEAIREHESLIRARYPVYIQGAFLMACADVLEKFPVSQEHTLVSFEESKENLSLKDDFVEIAKVLMDEAEGETPVFDMDPFEQYQSILEHMDRPASISIIGPDDTKIKDQFVSETTEHYQHNFAYYSVKTIASEEVFLSITKAILQKKDKDRLNIVFFLPMDHKTAPFLIQKSLLTLNHHDFAVVFRDVNTIRPVEDKLAKRQQMLDEQKPPTPAKDEKVCKDVQQKLVNQAINKRQLKNITDRHGRKIDSWVQAAAITAAAPAQQALVQALPQAPVAPKASPKAKGATAKPVQPMPQGTASTTQHTLPVIQLPSVTTHPQVTVTTIQKAPTQAILPVQTPPASAPVQALVAPPPAPPQPAHQVVQIQVNPAPAQAVVPLPVSTAPKAVPVKPRPQAHPAAPVLTPVPASAAPQAHPATPIPAQAPPKPPTTPQTKQKKPEDSIRVYMPKWPPMPPQAVKPELPPGAPIKQRTSPKAEGSVHQPIVDLVTDAPEEHTSLTSSGSERNR